MKLSGKTAIITGGGTGIGRAAARLFAREGASVMLAGRRAEKLAEVVSEIRSSGGKASFCVTDVSDAVQVRKLMEVTLSQFGTIDVLYNNAAVFYSNGKTVVDMEESEWDATIDVNLKGVFLCCKYAIPHMRGRGGVIVNCSSISGHVGQRRQGAYNAAKGGIEMLSKCMALDFAADNIRVNCVSPAWVEIDFNREDFRNRSDEIAALHPIGRAGQPEDVAKAVLFLACDDSSWVTGTSLMVDGGYTAE